MQAFPLLFFQFLDISFGVGSGDTFICVYFISVQNVINVVMLSS